MTHSEKGGRAVVVGGGVIGIACAHYLSKAGLRVTVIERGAVASGCSHANCGYISPSHVPPLTEPGAVRMAIKSLFNPRAPFRVKPTVRPALWSWMWQFARRCHHQQVLTAGSHLQSILDASMQEYRKLIDEESLECEWQNKGLLFVFRTQRGFDAYAETDRMLTENFGVSANVMTGDQLTDFEPGLRPRLAGAFHYPGDASVRPDRLCAQWTERLQATGVEFIEECPLQKIVSTQGRIVRLETSQGELEADHYVFAMGAWSPKWSKQLQCRIPIQPGKGYSVTMPRPENAPQHPMLLPECKVGVTPFQTGFRLGSMMEFAGYDTSVPERRIRQLRESARPYLVASVDGVAHEKWYGWRPMTWDSLPIIGPTPRLHNAYLATGHNMLGLTLAPSTGRLIAELVTRQPTHIPVSPFRVTRFE